MDQTLSTPLRMWFRTLALMIFAMVVIGGITRLTGSGLSMVTWAPVKGILPPLSGDEWVAFFEAYQASPEFKLVNTWMSLEDFKRIFWWEYIHRLFGRLIGIVFFVPLVLFAIKRAIPKWLVPHLIITGLLGCAQGYMGWYMVKSGLVNDPHVSAHRLAGHFTLALFLFGYFVILAHYHGKKAIKVPYLFIVPLSLLVFFTIFQGCFVAGLKAGLIYNTFPLMGGEWVPDDYWHLDGGLIKNAFGNPAAAQFNHRLLATLSLLTTVIGWLFYRKREGYEYFTRALVILALGLNLQYIFGILMLLHQVPVDLGVLHQGFALIVWTLLLRALFLDKITK